MSDLLWSKDSGSVPNAEPRLQSYRFSPQRGDRYSAEIATAIDVPKEIFRDKIFKKPLAGLFDFSAISRLRFADVH